MDGFLLPIYDLEDFNKKIDTIKGYIKKALDDEETSYINSIYLLELNTEYFSSYGEDELEEDDLLDIGPWENYKNCLYLEGEPFSLGFDNGLVNTTLEILYSEYKDFNQRKKDIESKKMKLTPKEREEYDRLKLDMLIKYYIHNIEEDDLLTLGGERYNTFNDIINEEENNKGKIIRMLVVSGELL